MVSGGSGSEKREEREGLSEGAAGVNYREDFTNSYCYFMPNGEGQSDYSTHFYWSVIGY